MKVDDRAGHVRPGHERVRNKTVVLDDSVFDEQVGDRLLVVGEITAPQVRHAVKNLHADPAMEADAGNFLHVQRPHRLRDPGAIPLGVRP